MKKTTTKMAKKTGKTGNPPNPELLKEKQLLIEKFCKRESINWPREMKVLGLLLKKEPIEFWKFLVLGFDLNSLAWFNSKDGQKIVSETKKTFLALQVKPPSTFEENFEYSRTTEHKQNLREKLTV